MNQNGSLSLVTGGGFIETEVYRRVKIVTGSRKNIYKKFGGIFGASSVVDPLGNLTSATRLVPGVRSGANYGDFTHNKVIGSLNLYLSGCIVSTETMNLFLSGSYTPINSWIPLVVWNDVLTGNIGLFISGLGTEDGAVPTNDSLNLFIQRNYTNAIPLMLQGPLLSSNNNLNLYLSGLITATGSIALAIPNVSDTKNNFFPCYLNGF